MMKIGSASIVLKKTVVDPMEPGMTYSPMRGQNMRNTPMPIAATLGSAQVHLIHFTAASRRTESFPSQAALQQHMLEEIRTFEVKDLVFCLNGSFIKRKSELVELIQGYGAEVAPSVTHRVLNPQNFTF